MKALVTGGAGFVGCHVAQHLVEGGDEVTVFDNLSRPGSAFNLDWLQTSTGRAARFVEGDVRSSEQVRAAAQGQELIYHLAAQVAVTTSLIDPRSDFEINLLGTLNVMEAARESGSAVFFTSTNKVYGGMDNIEVVERRTRYEYADRPFGVDEEQPLDFHSPYGCSKGGADQYVRDYARVYGIPTVVFRMSCIYGTRQFGNEDQGWLAHFVITAAADQPLVIFGDGKQVRDVLYVGDLARAFERARATLNGTQGRIFNIGGGPANTLSVWAEGGPVLERLLNRRIPVSYEGWRPGDQKVYVSDIRKARAELGWEPQISVEQGLRLLSEWVMQHGSLLRKVR